MDGNMSDFSFVQIRYTLFVTVRVLYEYSALYRTSIHSHESHLAKIPVRVRVPYICPYRICYTLGKSETYNETIIKGKFQKIPQHYRTVSI